MPKLKIYENRVPVPDATLPNVESLSTQGGGAARGIQQLGQAITGTAEALDQINEAQNLSTIQKKMSEADAKLNEAYDDLMFTEAEGLDREIEFEKFNEKVNDTFGAVEEEVSSRAGGNYFAVNSERLKGHHAHKAMLGESELAADQVQNEWTEGQRARSLSVKKNPQTNYMLDKMQEAEDYINSQPLILPQQKKKMIAESNNMMAISSARGWMEMNEEANEEAGVQIAKGTYDKWISGDDRSKLLGEVDANKRSYEIERDRRERALKKNQQESINKVWDDWIYRLNDEDKGNDVTRKEILNSGLPSRGPGGQIEAFKMLDLRNKNLIKRDDSIYIDVLTKIQAGEITREADLNKYIGAGLTFEDVKSFRKEIQGFGTQAGKDEADLRRTFEASAKGAITKSDPITNFRDVVGDRNYVRWYSKFIKEYRKQREAGVPSYKLLTPGEKEYLGKDVFSLRRSRKDVMRDNRRVSKGFAPTGKRTPRIDPRTVEKMLPGETIPQYKERMRKKGK